MCEQVPTAIWACARHLQVEAIDGKVSLALLPSLAAATGIGRDPIAR
jgi:hypothetical protein